jgi:hypothetical protein
MALRFRRGRRKTGSNVSVNTKADGSFSSYSVKVGKQTRNYSKSGARITTPISKRVYDVKHFPSSSRSKSKAFKGSAPRTATSSRSRPKQGRYSSRRRQGSSQGGSLSDGLVLVAVCLLAAAFVVLNLAVFVPVIVLTVFVVVLVRERLAAARHHEHVDTIEERLSLDEVATKELIEELTAMLAKGEPFDQPRLDEIVELAYAICDDADELRPLVEQRASAFEEWQNRSGLRNAMILGTVSAFAAFLALYLLRPEWLVRVSIWANQFLFVRVPGVSTILVVVSVPAILIGFLAGFCLWWYGDVEECVSNSLSADFDRIDNIKSAWAEFVDPAGQVSSD